MISGSSLDLRIAIKVQKKSIEFIMKETSFQEFNITVTVKMATSGLFCHENIRYTLLSSELISWQRCGADT